MDWCLCLLAHSWQWDLKDKGGLILWFSFIPTAQDKILSALGSSSFVNRGTNPLNKYSAGIMQNVPSHSSDPLQLNNKFQTLDNGDGPCFPDTDWHQLGDHLSSAYDSTLTLDAPADTDLACLPSTSSADSDQLSSYNQSCPDLLDCQPAPPLWVLCSTWLPAFFHHLGLTPICGASCQYLYDPACLKLTTLPLQPLCMSA